MYNKSEIQYTDLARATENLMCKIFDVEYDLNVLIVCQILGNEESDIS
jgi:hypothetical protein